MITGVSEEECDRLEEEEVAAEEQEERKKRNVLLDLMKNYDDVSVWKCSLTVRLLPSTSYLKI